MLLKDWSFVNVLDKNGDKVKEVTFLLVLAVNPRVAHLSWDIKCFLKNKVKGEGIEVLGKAELPGLIPQYFTKTKLFNGTYPEEGGIWIVKPTTRASSSGKGVTILSNKKDLNHVINELKGDPAIIQEYITDPLLFKGRKFHFRIWVMITTWEQYYIRPKWNIYTAKLPYKQDEWLNKDIHDSHLGTTDGNYYQSELANELPEDTDAQINGMVRDIVKICKIEPHEGVRFAYHVLGLDVMVAQNKLLLLEVNRSPGRTLLPFDPVLANEEWQWEWSCIEYLFKK